MSKSEWDGLKLENQLCFPLYACSREIIKQYRPYLEQLDLTYTQYLVMMVLWEEERINVKELGKKLFLDSGTLTPVLKSLEAKGYVTRTRSTQDERVLYAALTDQGRVLKKKAVHVPEKIAGCVHLMPEEAAQLYRLLYKILDSLQESDGHENRL